MGVSTTNRKRQPHGRSNVQPKVKKSSRTWSEKEVAQIRRAAFADGERAGFSRAQEEVMPLMRTLLRLEKKTDIHHKIREWLG